MIRLLMFSTMIIFAISVSAQQESGTKIPVNVVKSFQSAHPKAQDITWDKEGVNYEANYKENKNNFSVVIDKEGQILETESEISISDLPAGTVKYINDNFKGFSLSGAAKIIDNKGNVKYEAEIKKGKTSRDVMFGKDGTPLKSKKENEDNEEED